MRVACRSCCSVPRSSRRPPMRRPRRAARSPAAGKAAPACGAKVLPLVAGNTWTYNPVAAPTPPPEAIAAHRARAAEGDRHHGEVDREARAPTRSSRSRRRSPIDRTQGPEGSRSSTSDTITSDDHVQRQEVRHLARAASSSRASPAATSASSSTSSIARRTRASTLTKGAHRRDRVARGPRRSHVDAEADRRARARSSARGKLELERQFTPQPPEKVDHDEDGLVQGREARPHHHRPRDARQPLTPEGKPCSIATIDPEEAESRSSSAACELPANWISTLWLADGVGAACSR